MLLSRTKINQTLNIDKGKIDFAVKKLKNNFQKKIYKFAIFLLLSFPINKSKSKSLDMYMVGFTFHPEQLVYMVENEEMPYKIDKYGIFVLTPGVSFWLDLSNDDATAGWSMIINSTFNASCFGNPMLGVGLGARYKHILNDKMNFCYDFFMGGLIMPNKFCRDYKVIKNEALHCIMNFAISEISNEYLFIFPVPGISAQFQYNFSDMFASKINISWMGVAIIFSFGINVIL